MRITRDKPVITRLLRGGLAITVLTAGAVLSAHFVLDDAPTVTTGGEGTLALAPISLGNPAAAAVSLHVSGSHTGPYAGPQNHHVFNTYEQSLRVGRGDTLSGMLTDVGVPAPEARDAIQTLATVYDARTLRAGDVLTVRFQPDVDNLTPGRFLGLSIPETIRQAAVVSRDSNGDFTATRQDIKLTSDPAASRGVITSSLYVAGKKAGLPDSVLIDMIRIYSWDVDFQRDIREGDSFEVMYETLKDETGTVVDNGRIDYATLTLSGRRNTIYRHTTKDGEVAYFNDKGHGARKALLRTPIDGARLSSRFGNRRHPVLGYTKRHTGVDFAAPRGTPIYAAGDGTIDFIGRKGPNGNLIRIRHNGTYKTAYAHMKGFAKGLRKGARVKQGQIIGYVGTTGRSTGPHLHYEIQRNGRPANPLTVKMPSGRKLKGNELARFQETRRALRQQFATLPAATETVAQNNVPTPTQ